MPDTNFIAGTIWDARTLSRYSVDFISPPGVKSIYRYDYRTSQIYGAEIIGEQSPSFIYTVEGCDTEFVVGFLNFVKLIHWDGVSSTATVIQTLFEVKGHLNFALADKKGRLFTGTLNDTIFCAAPNEFATYRYADGQLTTIFTNMGSTSGLAIDYERNKFYHADFCRYQIVEFDYDCKTGDICNYFSFIHKIFSCISFFFLNKILIKGNGRVIYDFKNSGLTPLPFILGLNVDRNGYIYCSAYNSGLVFIIDPK